MALTIRLGPNNQKHGMTHPFFSFILSLVFVLVVNLSVVVVCFFCVFFFFFFLCYSGCIHRPYNIKVLLDVTRSVTIS